MSGGVLQRHPRRVEAVLASLTAEPAAHKRYPLGRVPEDKAEARNPGGLHLCASTIDHPFALVGGDPPGPGDRGGALGEDALIHRRAVIGGDGRFPCGDDASDGEGAARRRRDTGGGQAAGEHNDDGSARSAKRSMASPRRLPPEHVLKSALTHVSAARPAAPNRCSRPPLRRFLPARGHSRRGSWRHRSRTGSRSCPTPIARRRTRRSPSREQEEDEGSGCDDKPSPAPAASVASRRSTPLK
jgi:hypothetical protein